MKVLLANWVYNWGSTGYIIRDLKNEFTAMGHKAIVAAAESYGAPEDGVFVFAKPYEWKIMSRLARLGWPRFKGSKLASKRLIRIIEREKPDVVNLHLLHGARLDLYYLLKYLGQHHIKTVVTNHAELYYTGSCGYSYSCNQWVNNECGNCPDKKYATYAYVFANPHLHWSLMKKAFSYFDKGNLTFTAVSPWVQERFYQSPIVNGFDCSVVLNGIDIGVFSKKTNNTDFLNKIGENISDYVLHVTASFNPERKDDVKGGYYLVELAKRMPEFNFVVVCTAVKGVDQLPPNIFIWGKAKDQNELAQLYSNAKMTVLVSRRETFSMVTVESLCCGTPLVGFKAGGPESIALKEASFFVDQEDVLGLASAIKRMMNMSIDRNLLSEQAKEMYSARAMAKGYLSVYDEFLKEV